MSTPGMSILLKASGELSCAMFIVVAKYVIVIGSKPSILPLPLSLHCRSGSIRSCAVLSFQLCFDIAFYRQRFHLQSRCIAKNASRLDCRNFPGHVGRALERNAHRFTCLPRQCMDVIVAHEIISSQPINSGLAARP